MPNRSTSLMVAIGAAGLIAGFLAGGMRTAGQAPVAYQAPRSPFNDGHPDLSGVWQALNTANWDLQDHAMAPPAFWQWGAIGAVPAGQSVVEGGEIPYKPEALAQKKKNFENRFVADAYKRDLGDPEFKCYLPGIPRAAYMPYPFQILETPRYVLFTYEYANGNRIVRMDEPTEAPVDTWMGWSNGRWEGETLVVDVTGLNGQAWFDRAGNFASDTLHVVERYTRTDPDHLDYEATIEDPATFTRPWKIHMPLYRIVGKDAQILEFRCVEFSEEALYGSLTKEGHKPNAMSSTK